MDSELNICQATVRELSIVSSTTTGPLCCAHSVPIIFWLWRHDLKDYLRNINICFNGCFHSHLEQTMPQPEKQEFRINNLSILVATCNTDFLTLNPERSRNKLFQYHIPKKKLIRFFLFSAPNSKAYWDIAGLKRTFKTDYQQMLSFTALEEGHVCERFLMREWF
jgi:hypothetical protein